MTRRKAAAHVAEDDGSIRIKRVAIAKNLQLGSHIHCMDLDLKVLDVKVIRQDDGDDDVQLKVTTVVPSLKQSLSNEYISVSKTPFEVIVQSGPSYQVSS
jgi:hypothetical protein